jgi:ribonucleoside-diphosphate reductase alpha chain
MTSSQLDLKNWMPIQSNGSKAELSALGMQVLQKRCLMKNDKLEIVEDPSQLFRRVARVVATADSIYGNEYGLEQTEEEFYRVMLDLEFLPNSPALMSAGTSNGQLAACFVLPVEDSIKRIFSTLRNAAIIHKSGGGTGFSFSRIRPEGDIVRSTKGSSSGPLSFMRIFDQATETMKQGGIERGANMAILRVDHPDIMKFVQAKSNEDAFNNFNLSVAVTDSFVHAAKRRSLFYLRNPHTKRITEQIDSSGLLDEIAKQAWNTGEPGVIFIDEINRHNPTPHAGIIEATNTCGEQPLLPYESCVLGSINLSKVVVNGRIAWNKLESLSRTGVHFLDNIIDVTNFPIPKTAEITRANRKIGLGVMGFADMLIKLEIPYDSDNAVLTAREVMKFITEKARDESAKLAQSRGSFPNFNGSFWNKKGYKTMRNATLTTIAPTGTISMIAGCTQSIEPIFAIAPHRNIMNNMQSLGINNLFVYEMMRRGIYTESLLKEIIMAGSIQNISAIPKDLKRIFVTALDVKPEWHVRVQAAFQQHTDNAVAKTVNIPQEATIEDVRKIFLLAHELGCKGITVYRDCSRSKQVIYNGPARPKECSCQWSADCKGYRSQEAST